MIMVSQGEYKTVFYAIGTGIMALGMMIPAMGSGWIQEMLGYKNFFIWILITTIPGFIVAALVKIDPEYGKQERARVVSSIARRSLRIIRSDRCAASGIYEVQKICDKTN